MQDLNSRQYWDRRFNSGDWTKKGGTLQSYQHAREYIKHINLTETFVGTLCDFGCAEGDAFPIYKTQFPKAKLIGVDFSKTAIEKARKKYGDIGTFMVGEHFDIPPCEIIICSHILEHLSDENKIIKTLLSRCNTLYVIVPYKEHPIAKEHLRTYDEFSYSHFNPTNISVSPAGLPITKRQVFYDIYLKNVIRFLIGRKLSRVPQQILFEFHN